MKNLKNGFVALLLGVFFSGSLVWIVGLAAATPVPEFLSKSPQLVNLYYSELVTSFIALITSSVILFLIRRFVPSLTRQQYQISLIPMATYLTYLGLIVPFALPDMMWAAIPMALVILSLLMFTSEKQIES